MGINDVTGDKLVSKHGNKEAFDEGWDRIFGKKKPVEQTSEESTSSPCDCVHWTLGCCGSSEKK